MANASSKELVVRMFLPEETSASFIDELRTGTFALGRLSVGYFDIEINGSATIEEKIVEQAQIHTDPIGLGIKPRK